MKIIKKVKKGFTLIELLVVIAIMGSLGAVGYVAILAFSNAGDKQAAKENIKQIGTALTEFKKSYSYFPCDDTAESVAGKAESFGELTGDTSNPYFRQLFYKEQGGVNEELFYAALPNFVEGENTGVGETLKAGECAFSYVMRKPAATAATPTKKGGKNKKSAAPAEESSFRPVSNGPIAFCGATVNPDPTDMVDVTFDIDSFNGYAFAVRTDGKIVTMEEDVLEADASDSSIGRFIPGTEPFAKKNGVSEMDNCVLLSPEPLQK